MLNYLPRGEVVDAWQWEAVPDRDGKISCAL